MNRRDGSYKRAVKKRKKKRKKTVRLLKVKVRNVGSYQCLGCFGFLFNLYEFFKLYSR